MPLLRAGQDITLVGYGTLVNELLLAADLLKKKGVSAEVLKLPSIKPLDIAAIRTSVRKTGNLLIAEEAVCTGCAGKEIAAALRAGGLNIPIRLCNAGDRFVPHGAVKELYRLLGLDAQSLAKTALEVLQREA